MYKEETKKELKAIYTSTEVINKELINIKIAIHDLEKLGYNTGDLEKLLENVGIEFYKFKTQGNDLINTLLGRGE